MARDAAFSSGDIVPSFTLWLKEKKPKRKQSYNTEAKEKPPIIEEISEGPNTVVLDEEGTEDDAEIVSLQRREKKNTNSSSGGRGGTLSRV